jgi:hypothetical protein
VGQAGQSLSDAAYAGELDKIDDLLASGVDINACDQVGDGESVACGSMGWTAFVW